MKLILCITFYCGILSLIICQLTTKHKEADSDNAKTDILNNNLTEKNHKLIDKEGFNKNSKNRMKIIQSTPGISTSPDSVLEPKINAEPKKENSNELDKNEIKQEQKPINKNNKKIEPRQELKHENKNPEQKTEMNEHKEEMKREQKDVENFEPPNDKSLNSTKNNPEEQNPLEEFYYGEEAYFYARNIKCNHKNCFNPNYCQDESTCRCGEGRAEFTPPEGPRSNRYCQYRQKLQLVAFLLETFVAAGIGHFYAGRIGFGILKLIVCILPLLMVCCTLCMKTNDGCVPLVSSVSTCTFLIWQIIDIINFATNSYKDGNGVPLAHW